MIIENVDPSRDSFTDYSLEGTELTIGDVTVDLADEEGDQEVIITFGSCNGKVHRGLMPCCQYVADVIIPPRKYETVEVEGPSQGTTGTGNTHGKNNEDETPTTHTENVRVPLDTDSVTLRLWPIPDQNQPIQAMEGEIDAVE
jgi:hypothetical protein